MKKHALVGSWKLTKAISNGEIIDPVYFSSTTRTFDGDFFVVTSPEVNIRARYFVDDSSNPKKIKVEYLTGPRAQSVVDGIYDVADGRLRICMPTVGSANIPSSFESGRGSRQSLDFYELNNIDSK